MLRPVPVREGERIYPSSMKEFELGVIDVAPGRTYQSEEAYGAEVLVVLEADGDLEVSSTDGPKKLHRGQSLFVTHGTTYRIAGLGTIARAVVPIRPLPGAASGSFGTSGLRGRLG
jgi:mannose-6-phosphate isomerase class I